jgi:hypothetical protein
MLDLNLARAAANLMEVFIVCPQVATRVMTGSS